ncbi:MAG: metal-dependent transcriptional regulator [Sedimentisphaerales bacterium]|jgi:DtxR family Mn-dependent transcriptional regulator
MIEIKRTAAVKNNGLSASQEDYLEAILNVADASGVARSTDIAVSLGVAKPSVTGALKLLAKRGLVNYKPYGCVTFTQKGVSQAGRVAQRHEIIKSFFVDVLNVDAAVAQKAACKAEHLLGPVIISRMRDFTDLTKKKARCGRTPNVKRAKR